MDSFKTPLNWIWLDALCLAININFSNLDKFDSTRMSTVTGSTAGCIAAEISSREEFWWSGSNKPRASCGLDIMFLVERGNYKFQRWNVGPEIPSADWVSGALGPRRSGYHPTTRVTGCSLPTTGVADHQLYTTQRLVCFSFIIGGLVSRGMHDFIMKKNLIKMQDQNFFSKWNNPVCI